MSDDTRLDRALLVIALVVAAAAILIAESLPTTLLLVNPVYQGF